jgi:hypothetical protein
VFHELRLSGFSNAGIVPMTDERSWLNESGCCLYECKVFDSDTDAPWADS